MQSETDNQRYIRIEEEPILWRTINDSIRTLISVDQDYNVTFADDLTLDEAKEVLRRWAIMLAKITKAQAEAIRS